MYSAEVLDFLWLAAVAAHAAWAARLFITRASGTYPVLTSFLIFSALQSAIGFSIYRYFPGGFNSEGYAWFWVISRLLTFTLYFCLLVEIGRRMLNGYRGFERLGNMLIFWSLAGVGILLSVTVLTQQPEQLRSPRNFWFLEERSIYLGLTVVALLLAGFALYFQLRPVKNVRVILAVFGLLFCGEAVLWSLRQYFGNTAPSPFDFVSQLLYLVCPFLGAWAFSRAGEQQPWTQFHPAVDTETEALLAEKLSSYNQTLLRVLRS